MADDDNVIQFPRRPPDDTDRLLVCQCSCTMFRLWESGEIECLNCAGILIGLRIEEDPE